jgi:hypothetical protein
LVILPGTQGSQEVISGVKLINIRYIMVEILMLIEITIIIQLSSFKDILAGFKDS